MAPDIPLILNPTSVKTTPAIKIVAILETNSKERGACPYAGVRVERAANFQERKECWGLKHKKYTIYQLMDEILKLKCKGRRK